MGKNGYRRIQSRAWMIALVVIATASFVVFFATYLIDTRGPVDISLIKLLTSPEAHAALSNMPEVIAGLLGITITVVAIIVELASNRYTPRVTDLFVRSIVNFTVLGFFVVTGIMGIWVSLSGTRSDYVPAVGTIVTAVAMTIALIILLPYFAFVFNFLNPHNIIERMGQWTMRAVRRGCREQPHRYQNTKLLALTGIEQLADVALNSIEHKDKGISMHAVDTLGELARLYMNDKRHLPAAWFILDAELKENPDFVSMQVEVLENIEHRKFWFEMKILRQYQMIYGETLNKMRDINYLIAINTRKIAERGMLLKEDFVTELAQKFFNTYLRATINGEDVRTAYNVLNQYRLLAETALRLERHDIAVEAAKRFKYYGQLGFSAGLPFILETVAYDLCTLNEFAFDLKAACQPELLSQFLEVDKEAEAGHEFEASLRGVRKAQVKLATYFLLHGADNLARAVFEDMQSELPTRLASIQQELAGITSKEFWEINDRGINFDYLEPKRRAKLEQFFGWFETS